MLEWKFQIWHSNCNINSVRMLLPSIWRISVRTKSSIAAKTLLDVVKAQAKRSSSMGESEFKTKTPPVLRREKQQQAAKKKNTPFIPGQVNLQILGSGANGAPCSVYLFTDQARYLFNCGEGTQRLAHEHKIKLSRLEQIFLTRNTWTMLGGMPGLALTLQDTGVRELTLHGPPHVDEILTSMKRFVALKNLQITTKNSTQLHHFEDATMSVKCVPLYASADPKEVVIAYICKLKPRPGALKLEKCVEYGVKPGPLLGLLKNGMDITLEDGTIVRSKDVSEPAETALSFVVLDIPSERFLPALQSQAELFSELKHTTEHEVALVLHFTPEHVLQNNCYKDFLQNFSPHSQHVYLNSCRNSFSGYNAAHRIQYQLNMVNPHVFPLLGETEDFNHSHNLSSKLKKTKLEEAKINEAENNGNSNFSEKHVSNIATLTSFHLRPRKGLDRSLESRLSPSDYINEAKAVGHFTDLSDATRRNLSIFNQDRQECFPKVVFLGTGSCIPNKTRNVSSILLQVHGSSYILLDCGEGTLGQIIRFYGVAQAQEVMRNLHAIYVSHLHADHHIGLIGLLRERQRLLSEKEEGEHKKTLLLAPRQIQPWLEFYDERIQKISDCYELIGNSELLQQPLDLIQRQEIGVDAIATCLVRHCPHSFGISLTMRASNREAPIKITYSGDTMPCEDLIELGKNSTILIHEATMEDDLEEEARIKTHSTTSQAIEQGLKMNAEHIILTHFSQRYAKLPRMQNIVEEDEEAVMRNVAIAFDNMQVTLDDLQHFHLMYPAIKALFAEYAEDLELKAFKREMKLERKRKLDVAE